MHFCLLTGTPGLGKSAIKQKLVDHLQREGLRVGRASVEEELLGILAPDDPSMSLVRLIGERPQDFIRNSWGKAYSAAYEKASSGAPDVAIVLTRLVYYRYETYEFFSPVDTEAITAHPPHGVLTLIDDVYDAYYRLSQAGQVFDIKVNISRLAKGTKKRHREPGDLSALYKDALNTTIDSLLRVLAWREKEIGTAAILARAAQAPSGASVLAVKHHVATAARLVLGKASQDLGWGQSYPVYISHPITRPREENVKTDQWPGLVAELDDVIERLGSDPVGECHVIPIRPTAIDEFRLLRDGEHLIPRLKARWPLPHGELLYSCPNGFDSYDEFERRGIASIFDPPINDAGRRIGIPLTDDEISGMLRTLELAVRLQMAGRDHLLVRQCPGLFLYRPTCGEHKFSGGVTTEIENFEGILKHVDKVQRRIAFMHDAEDAKELFKGNQVHVQVAAGRVCETVQRINDDEGKQIQVIHPDIKDMTEALALLQKPTSSLCDSLLTSMYAPNQDSAIGTTRPLPLESVRDRMLSTIANERTKLLTSALLNDPWKYTFHIGEGCIYTSQHPEGGVPRNVAIDVVQDLNNDPQTRIYAIDRAREFFASGLQEDEEPQVSSQPIPEEQAESRPSARAAEPSPEKITPDPERAATEG